MGPNRVKKPGEVYLATERLMDLFASVDGVLLVNDAYACLRGEDIRELLEACGATRSLQPVPVECHLSWEQLTKIRRTQGLERLTWERRIDDKTLRGLDALLGLLPSVGPAERRQRSALLWEASRMSRAVKAPERSKSSTHGAIRTRRKRPRSTPPSSNSSRKENGSPMQTATCSPQS